MMNIKKTGLQLLTGITLLTVAHSAFALSCARPDPVMQCEQMQNKGEKSPALAEGQLQLVKVISQKTSQNKHQYLGGKGPAVAEYRFTGSLSDKSGKRDVTDEKIMISTSCAGPWCARLPTDKKSGYFLLTRDATAELKLKLGACSAQPFSATKQQVEALENCVTPEPVKPKPSSKPNAANNTAGSQIYSQGNGDNKLVQ